ncbi:Phospholipid-transporting ATPase 1 [Hordeum vulgare]|nr:Phospholipid-transporting ATPase 1 [Hordeum vulgare]
MDDDAPPLDAAGGLASLAFAGSHVGRKGLAPAKKKKVLTPKERLEQSLRRKNHRHLQESRNEVVVVSSLATALEKEANIVKNSHLVHEATRQTLLMLGLNPGQHGLVTASTGSSPLLHQLPDSPCMSFTPAAHGFQRHHPQTYRLSYSTGFGSPEVFQALEAFKGRGEKEAFEEDGEGEKPRPRGKTNSKKEDKHEVTSLALQATLQGMIANEDSREEKRRQDKEEQIRAFVEIQNKKLALEAEKQAKMVEIETTKAREVQLAGMMKGVEIMKVDLSMVFPRKWSWFEKTHADIFSLEDDRSMLQCAGMTTAEMA